MSNPRVLCLGEILFDCLADQLGRRLENVESWTPYPGGAPANVACALVKLGTSAGFIGALGIDEPGNSLIQVLQDVGVDMTGVQRHPTAPTRQVYVVRDLDGDRSFAGFGKHETNEFADTFLQAEQLPHSLFENAELLVLGTLELAYPDSGKAVHHALKLAEKYDLKIVLDVNWRPVFWQNPDIALTQIQSLFSKVDFVKLAKEEAEWLFDTDDPGAITYKIDGVEGVLVTDGEKGCAYCLSENEGKLPAFPMTVADTTGAGDSFSAGFIHQLLIHGVKALGDPQIAKQIVTYASAVGALTTIKPGAIASQPIAAEVEAFLAQHQL
ncbi:carbohydrate kinase family protein [Calothrix rhizosoleniae]|uniref:carbohydrate kinase family protein n=1 Tax=Calothrix rhizosoleniae TaxID=888997 RepID=UPI000B4A33F9|nr:carbohydrate kinase [Calothrix rhizosoleniae]